MRQQQRLFVGGDGRHGTLRLHHLSSPEQETSEEIKQSALTSRRVGSAPPSRAAVPCLLPAAAGWHAAA